jgi:integrase
MPTVRLTDRFVATAVAPTGERAEFWDAQVSGLGLRVSDRGRKTWIVRYRTLRRRQPRFTLGTYPAISLADARGKAIDTMRAAQNGADPAAERRQERSRARTETLKTFDNLAEAYFKACEAGEWMPKGKKQRPRTLNDSRAVWQRYVTRVIGSKRLDEIKRIVVKTLLRDMAARGIGAQTKRTQAFIRGVYAWAISEFEEELVQVNPAMGFSPVGHSAPRLRIYRDDELRALWRGLNHPERLSPTGADALGVSRQMALIIQLAAILLQRKSEVAGMHESELDLVQKTWLIPGHRMKSGWPHLVPLPPAAIPLIEEAKRLRRRQEGFDGVIGSNTPRLIFPSRKDPTQPIRGDSVTRAMRRLCKALDLKDLTVHDLRRTGSSIMTSERLKVMPFIRSKVLAHRGDTGGGAAVSMLHYDANEYVVEKRQAIESWARLLMEIVQGGDPGQAANENRPVGRPETTTEGGASLL